MATVIGLDIGSSAVRAAQITAARRGPAVLDRVGEVALPPGAVRDGEIAQPDVVVEALRELWGRHRLRTRKVALGLANQQVIVRRVELPYMTDAELRESLALQAQEYIPIPVDEAILDYHAVDEVVGENGEHTRRIVLVAAQREMVGELVAVVRKAKLEPVAIDLEAFAMMRSLAPEGLFEPTEGEVIVNVGAAVTNVVVHTGGVPRFVRILLMGGNAITDGLVTRLSLSVEDAEAAKIMIGLAQADDAPGTTEVIAERAGRLVDEVRGSLDYYAGQADASPVHRVVLSGGASRLPHLAGRLSEALRLPVEAGHPLQELKLGKTGLDYDALVDAQPVLSVAVGLALGAAA